MGDGMTGRIWQHSFGRFSMMLSTNAYTQNGSQRPMEVTVKRAAGEATTVHRLVT